MSYLEILQWVLLAGGLLFAIGTIGSDDTGEQIICSRLAAVLFALAVVTALVPLFA